MQDLPSQVHDPYPFPRQRLYLEHGSTDGGVSEQIERGLYSMETRQRVEWFSVAESNSHLSQRPQMDISLFTGLL